MDLERRRYGIQMFEGLRASLVCGAYLGGTLDVLRKEVLNTPWSMQGVPRLRIAYSSQT